jgi:hypothetical protein
MTDRETSHRWWCFLASGLPITVTGTSIDVNAASYVR